MTDEDYAKLHMARHKLAHILWYDKYYDKAAAKMNADDALKLIEEVLANDRTR